MFSIGAFSQLGQVSVRVLRHYDAIGLLRPAHVDPGSGHRFYRADQLSRLNRVIALKDLGLTLRQIGSILDERVDTAELYGMLRLRRAELCRRVDAAGVKVTGYGIARYEPEADGRVTVRAGLEVAAETSGDHDFAVVDLPEIEQAATIIHRGPMEEVGPTFQTLAHWIDEHDYRGLGLAREVSIDCPEGDHDNWVTELQMTVTRV
ncbi:MerR family transcriptional regulator [Streptosporangium sp. NPDC002721]|uniref:MerR family transcriptional regulator n=1 Tax=Streptosporangium sp. NPDC002721 TaxID=3366188 RepID=UPI003694ABBF